MANYDSVDYTNGARVRASSDSPEWRQFSITIPAGVALVDEDELRFCKMGADHKILQYTLGCDASLGTSANDSADLVVGGIVIDAAVETDGFAVADRTYGATIAVAHITADGDIVKLDTSTALDSQTTSGARTITLGLLVARQSNATYTGERLTYSSPYTL